MAKIFAIAIAVSALAAPTALAQQEIEILPVQGNVYMLASPSGNVTVSVGDEGVLLVDTNVAEMSDRVLAAIRKLSDKPVRFIINTDVHPDHTGGNESMSKKAGAAIGAGGGLDPAAQGAVIIAHQTVLSRMSAPTGSQAPAPFAAWPTDTFSDEKEAFFNGEAIQITHQPAAHTDGDSLVFFRRSDVVATGDIFRTDLYPVIDLERGGTINGVVNGLNQILHITVPKNIQEDGTLVVPGHGRLCDEDDVVEYRDMVTIIRDRIQDMVAKGMTLEQVKAARPTRDYDGIYGSTTGFWTTDKFVEAVYRTLK